jgi:hypothetical protein
MEVETDGDIELDAPTEPPVTYIMRIAGHDSTTYCNFIVETGEGDLAFMGVSKPGGEQQDIWAGRIGNTEWTKIIGKEEGREWIGGFIQTSDGTFAAAGWSSDSWSGEEKSLIMKLSSEGDVVWQKTIVGVDRLDGVLETADGNLVVSGSADFNLFLTEIDPSGSVVKQQVASGDLLFNMFELVQAAGGDILAAGQSSEGAGLAKVSMDGRVYWCRHFSSPSGVSFNEVTVLELSDGRIVMSLGGRIMMLDGAGIPLWQMDVPPVGGPAGTDVMEADDGGLIFLSTSEAPGNDPNMWLYKTDDAGTMLWQKIMSLEGLEGGRDISKSSGGGLFALSGGAYWSNLALLRPDGSMYGSCDALVDTTLSLAPASGMYSDIDLTLHDPGFAVADTSLPSIDTDREITYPCPPERP